MWLDTFPGSLDPRPALEGDRDADVAIVGGGFTGLWTAYYLLGLDPTLRITIDRARHLRLRRLRPQRRLGGGRAGRGHQEVRCPGRSAGVAAARPGRVRQRRRGQVGSLPPRGSTAATTRAGWSGSPATAPRPNARPTRSPTTTRLGLNADEIRQLTADEARTHARVTGVLQRHLLRPLRGDRPGPAGAGTGRGGGAARVRPSTSKPAAAAIEPGRVLTDRGHGAGRGGGAGHRGLHPGPAGPPAPASARLLADDRHRAAAAGGVRRDRPGRPAHLRRRPLHGDLRPAHRGQPHRLRRPGSALPVRIAHQPVGGAPPPFPRSHPPHAGGSVPRTVAGPGSPTVGAACSG